MLSFLSSVNISTMMVYRVHITSQKISSDYPIAYIFGLILSVIIFISGLMLAKKHQLTGFQLSLFRDIIFGWVTALLFNRLKVAWQIFD